MENIPVIKLGLVAVSRDCFPIVLSEKRRAANDLVHRHADDLGHHHVRQSGQRRADHAQHKKTPASPKETPDQPVPPGADRMFLFLICFTHLSVFPLGLPAPVFFCFFPRPGGHGPPPEPLRHGQSIIGERDSSTAFSPCPGRSVPCFSPSPRLPSSGGPFSSGFRESGWTEPARYGTIQAKQYIHPG